MVQNKIPGFDRIVVENHPVTKKVSPFQKVETFNAPVVF